MFKGNLVENQLYYKLRSRLLVISILASMVGGFLGNFWMLPIFWIIVIGWIILIMFLITKRLHQHIAFLSNQKRIEVDGKSILIKTKKGDIIEQIDIDKDTQITVIEEYKIPGTTFRELVKEMRGHPVKNSLFVAKGINSWQFEFTIDSYYMIEQIKKVIGIWRSDGIHVEVGANSE